MEKTNTGITVAIVIALILVGVGMYNLKNNPNTELTTQNSATTTMDVNTNGSPMVSDTDTLIVTTLAPGEGAQGAQEGNKVTVHYTGWLTSGAKFDSSYDHGKPFTFTLGAGSVIAGWEEGVKGMKVGEKRRLIIPSAMGYGEVGAGGVIPPNATLVFEVELLEIGQ